MSIKRTVALACALCWAAGGAFAAPAGLSELYQKARLADPDFGAAYASYQAGLTNREIGRAGLLPSVSASVAATRTGYGLETTAARWSETDFTTRAKTIQLTQPVFDWDKIAGYQESNARAAYAEALFAEARADLIVRVARGYFNYLLAFDNLDLAQAQKTALAQQRIQAEKLHQSGVGTVTDEEETKARHEIAEAQYLAALSTLEVRRRELAKMTGMTFDAVRRIGAAIVLAAPEPAVLAPWLEAGARSNPKVLSGQVNLKVSQAQVARARAGHLPSLSLVASYQKNDEPNYFTKADEGRRVGLQLSIPLFEGGRTSAVQAQAAWQKERARGELEAAVADSQIRVSEAFLGIVNGIPQVRAMEQAVKSSETALRGMEIGQRAGFRTNTDVLNAQQQLFSARRDLQRERYNYLLNRLQLNAAVGTLGDDDVDLIDRMAGQGAQ